MGLLGAGAFCSICIYKGDEKFYSKFLMPVLHRCVDGETAHNLSVFVAQMNLLPAANMKKSFETNLVSEEPLVTVFYTDYA